MSEQPTETPAAQQESPSQAEQIRQKLKEHLASGVDFTDAKARTAAGHQVADALGVPYASVSKHYRRAHGEFTNRPQPPTEARAKVEGADVKVNIPDRQKPDDQPPPSQAEQQAAAPKVDYRKVYAEAKDVEALRETPEYKFLRMQVDMGVKIIEGTYKKMGLAEQLAGGDEMEMMKDATVQMSMKYNWQVPEKIEKLVFFGSWGAILVLPVLNKVGVFDWIAGGDKKAKDKAPPHAETSMRDKKDAGDLSDLK